MPTPDETTPPAPLRRARKSAGSASTASDFETGRQLGDISARTTALEQWKGQVDGQLMEIKGEIAGLRDEVRNRDEAQTKHLEDQDRDLKAILGRDAANAVRRDKWITVIVTAALGTVATYIVQQVLVVISAPHALQSGGPLGVVVATAVLALLLLRR